MSSTYTIHIPFARLKYTIQWLLVYSQNFVTTTSANFRIFLSSQKLILCVLVVTPHLSSAPIYHQPSAAANLLFLSRDFSVLEI